MANKKQTELSVLVEIKRFLESRFPFEPVKKPEADISNSEFSCLLHSPARFEKLSDGWIKDRLLGLDWGPSSGKYMNYEEAEKYVSSPGVRLPECWELETLINRSRREPAILPIFINDTKFDDWYWTKTPVAGDPYLEKNGTAFKREIREVFEREDTKP